jgi:hypothetical protein
MERPKRYSRGMWFAARTISVLLKIGGLSVLTALELIGIFKPQGPNTLNEMQWRIKRLKERNKL